MGIWIICHKLRIYGYRLPMASSQSNTTNVYQELGTC